MQILRGKRTGATGLAISPDSRFLAAGGNVDTHVWDLHDPSAKPARVGERSVGLYGCDFVADGRLFVTGLAGWRLYDPVTGRSSGWPRGGASPGLARSTPCGQFVLERTPTELACWRLTEEGPELRRELVWSKPWADWWPVLAPDSERFFLAWGIYRVADAQPLANLECLGSAQAPVYFTADGRGLLSTTLSWFYAWDAHAGGKGRVAARHPAKRHYRKLAVHPGGAIVAGVMTDDSVVLFDLLSGGFLRAYGWEIGKLQHVAFTPDGTRCAVAGTTGKILVFDVE